MMWLRMQRIGRRCLSLSVARRGDASESGYHGRDDWRYTPTEDELYKMSQKEYLDKLKGLVTNFLYKILVVEKLNEPPKYKVCARS